MQRRLFLSRAAALAATAVGGSAFALDQPPFANAIDLARVTPAGITRSPTRLRVLVLGGTYFAGPPLVAHLVSRGHEVTLFNRGKTNAQLFPGVEKLRGDREAGPAGLAALKDCRWDVAIDTWQGAPSAISDMAAALKGRVSRMVHVSTIAVYGRRNYETLKEVTEEATLPERDRAELTATTPLSYPARKYWGDRLVREAWGDSATVVRPHVICGYYLTAESDAQRYWPARFARGGEVLCPGDGEDNAQFVDVGDLAAWLVQCAERDLAGLFNLGQRMTWREHAARLNRFAGSNAQLKWVDYLTLEKAGVRRGVDIPLFLPRQIGPGFLNISDARAVARGHTYRAAEETWKYLLDGFRATEKLDYEFGAKDNGAGLTRARERELLSISGANAPSAPARTSAYVRWAKHV